MLNRSAIVVKPRQLFLDWLHTADLTTHRLALRDLPREPTIYLIPECDTEEDAREVLEEFCKRFLLRDWRVDSEMNRPGRKTSGSMPSAVGSISNTIQCWWIYPMNR